MNQREIQLAKIELRIKEVEESGEGKVIIFVKKGEIVEWQIIKLDKEK